MCKILKISRTVYYYKKHRKETDGNLENTVIKIFEDNRKVYGTRKIKQQLKILGVVVSRRRISRIMRKYQLISKYTNKQYKVHHNECNQAKIGNIVNREFDNRKRLEVIVSDLTYVNVASRWNYICFILDLYNREVIGYSAGIHKDARLVYDALLTIKKGLHNISIFHTDRGNEFKNKLIDEVITTFGITRSLSNKGTPYDNAVSEATFKILKTEFIDKKIFKTLNELKVELMDYVNWYNTKRIHGSLSYKTPEQWMREAKG